MKKKILLTSFDTWLADQKSNSSDDLLIEVAKLDSIPHHLTFLRQLPVELEQASSRVIQKINEIQPDVVICCGMAQSRTQLSIEVGASSTDILLADCATRFLQTTVDLKKLVAGTTAIEISHDCGKFVCEGLYYSVLDYLSRHQLNSHCIFVHVPILNQKNLVEIIANFLLIIQNLALL